MTNHRTVYYFGGVHPIQESVIRYPPDGYDIISNVKISDFDVIGEYSFLNSSVKQIASTLFNMVQRPRLIIVTKRCDMIHTTSGVIPLNKKPFVVSAEYYSSFVGLQHELAVSAGFRRNTTRHLTSARCKAILPFSEAARTSIINAFWPESRNFSDRIQVVYPAIPEMARRIDTETDRVRILHIGSGFFEKGGRELFLAVESLIEKEGLDIELCAITSAPPHHYASYERFISRFRGRDRFRIIERPMPREILFKEFYSKSDIFALPSFGDFFGYVFLEAMASGLPLVGTSVFAIPEIIEDQGNGYLVPAPITPFRPDMLRRPKTEVDDYLTMIGTKEFVDLKQDLTNVLRNLVCNKSLRTRMGRRSSEIVREGKFSIKQRNLQLKGIYDSAIEAS